jgi:hypothetical protein
MAKVDLKKLSNVKLQAMLDEVNAERDKLIVVARAITAELRTREATAKIKAELEKLPQEQRKAILGAVTG